MERLDYAQFVRARSDFDAVVARYGDGLSSCSLSPWQLSAHDSMADADPADGRRHLIYASEHAWLAMVEFSTPHVYVPFESTWMFACPLVGEPRAALELLAAVVREERGELRALLLGGLPLGGDLHRLLASGASKSGYTEQEGVESCIIDLGQGGLGSWLARRTRNFRRSAVRATFPAGVEVVDGQALLPDEAFARILSIQARSRKARDDEDIFSIPMYHDFYLQLLRDVHASGELRLSFAVRGGEDLAYHFGFTRGPHYRGYQMSFVEEARPLGLGTALQMHHLRRAEEEGVTRYDLGMLAPYKERWCDRIDRSVIAMLQ